MEGLPIRANRRRSQESRLGQLVDQLVLGEFGERRGEGRRSLILLLSYVTDVHQQQRALDPGRFQLRIQQLFLPPHLMCHALPPGLLLSGLFSQPGVLRR